MYLFHVGGNNHRHHIKIIMITLSTVYLCVSVYNNDSSTYQNIQQRQITENYRTKRRAIFLTNTKFSRKKREKLHKCA